MKSWPVFLTVWMMVLCSIHAPEARCETVRLPITIDLPLLRSLIVQQAYPDPGETARVIDRAGGCNQVVLSAPQVSVEQEQLRFQTTVRLKWGTPIGGGCFAPLAWEGAVALWQRPRINDRWQLSFETIDSALLDRNGKPVKMAAVVWNQIKGYVHGYLQQISIDLAPPVGDMKNFLLPLFDDSHQSAAKYFLASMRPEQPVLTADGLQVNILAHAETTGQVREGQPVPMASPEALAKVMELWQTWDALLIHLISQFSNQPLSDDDRHDLMDTILRVRYEFEEALSKQELTSDFVRGQFVWSWQQLESVFRRHLSNSPSDNLLGYLAFFTAADALVALDHIGPAMGIEVSRDGFHRLAELISSAPVGQLQATPEVNALLREILGLGPPLEVLMPKEESTPVPAREDDPPTSWYRFPAGWRIWNFPGCSRAWAEELRMPSLKEIRGWTAEATSNDVLLKKVRKVLEEVAGKQHKNLKPPTSDTAWFDTMITATAWQESCFRQFHVKKNKVTYLLSYNRTSVGLMQVNERIWRGIYDREQLRWNVRYNARAGSEILTLYLNRYINKVKTSVNLSSNSGKRFLAVWLYSLYNGGPSQLKKLPKRHREKKFYQSEQLFLTKYDQVQGGGWINRVDCL